jgi:hypothetical protein
MKISNSCYIFRMMSGFLLPSSIDAHVDTFIKKLHWKQIWKNKMQCLIGSATIARSVPNAVMKQSVHVATKV